MGKVILNIKDDMPIVSQNGTALTFNDIKNGQKIIVEYSENMTEDNPPINNPIRIVIDD